MKVEDFRRSVQRVDLFVAIICAALGVMSVIAAVAWSAWMAAPAFAAGLMSGGSFAEYTSLSDRFFSPTDVR